MLIWTTDNEKYGVVWDEFYFKSTDSKSLVLLHTCKAKPNKPLIKLQFENFDIT